MYYIHDYKSLCNCRELWSNIFWDPYWLFVPSNSKMGPQILKLIGKLILEETDKKII